MFVCCLVLPLVPLDVDVYGVTIDWLQGASC